MALDEKHFLSAPLEQHFLNKDNGQPLAAGTLRFYRDNARGTPKNVFQLSGVVPNYTYTSIGSTITLDLYGSIQNSGGDNVALYLYPYDENGDIDLYYIECYSAGGVLQWTREGWPNLTAENDPTTDNSSSANQIANPQFTEIFFNESGSTTLTNASGTNSYQIAPDWFLEVSSSASASVVISRVALAVGAAVPSRAPYALQVDCQAGITACKLVQRKKANAALWTSTATRNIYLSGSFTAKSISGGTLSIALKYRESSGVNATTPVDITSGSFGASDYVENSGVSNFVPTSTSAETGDDAYIDIYVDLPLNSICQVTSIQVVPSLRSDIISFDMDTSKRNLAYMGDYFLPALEQRTAKSILQGWNFAVNPNQFQYTGATYKNGAPGLTRFNNSARYIADQTIAIASNTTTPAAYINVDYVSADGIKYFKFTSTEDAQSFMLHQYLEGDDVKALMTNRLSMNILAWASAADVTVKIYLFRGKKTALSTALGAPDNFPDVSAGNILGTFSPDGTFALNGAYTGWSSIPRGENDFLGIPSTTLKTLAALTELATHKHDHGFSQWEITDATDLSDTDKFACLVTFTVPTSGTEVNVADISLTKGDIPTRTHPQTENEVMLQMQKYWETNYPRETTIPTNYGAGPTTNARNYTVALGDAANAPMLMNAQFNSLKRSAPNMACWNVNGAIVDNATAMGTLAAATLPIGITHGLTGANIKTSRDSLDYVTTAITAAVPSGLYAFFWTADARIGYVVERDNN